MTAPAIFPADVHNVLAARKALIYQLRALRWCFPMTISAESFMTTALQSYRHHPVIGLMMSTMRHVHINSRITNITQRKGNVAGWQGILDVCKAADAEGWEPPQNL